MGSTISNSAPIAPIVSGVEPAQQSDAERTSDLQRAYHEQCRAALGKRDDGRDCDDTEAQRAHARKKTKRNGEPPGAAGGMPAPHAARDRAFALRFGGARLGEARSGANARDARVGAGAEADIEAGIEAGVGVGTDAHAAGGARTRGEIAARGGATMRGHAPASGAVRATSERAPAAATADAHAPQAAAESAPPSVPMPAAHAAPRTSGGSARDIAAAAARICATAADPAAGVVASRSPALPAARGPASATAAASAMSAMSSTRRPTAAASPGAARERVDGDDSNRAGDASLAGLPRGVQPQASLRAAEPAARAHDPSRAARQRAQAGAAQADARDVRETQGTQVRYSFNSWDGRPAVELRFDAGGAPRVVNAQPSHDRVQRAMEHGADRLSPGWTVEFDRSRADDDSGGRSPWRRARQEPEADER
ncbi:BsaU protein [Burkholderia pseudomallei]|uniref:Type III secretion system protein BsaU n=1 Tax=Burkholderia pseudomallei TaxID=28450 RepID=A0A8A4DYM5_BURPE|nr:type III secretion system protein BsaU [Burkholderia pseudomallei]MBF3412113.1 type III secretion system protein BsaU [Burkholderia pseudomallei]MBF3621933.1 type III secretion system protein BsaU [Burkholderia pseudomallei]MBF3651551.1 type III secretion system protein BsaU [Burkholderia pseudomallei]MBF3669765.1 type III secretion system protein BsaU [Burkholderia pseudomallei]MBF3762594.1 type III secretion system protein BsaU [Burkholderia pseudomallei]